MTKKELIEENNKLLADIKSLVIYNEETIHTYMRYKVKFEAQKLIDELRWDISVDESKHFNGVTKNKTNDKERRYNH